MTVSRQSDDAIFFLPRSKSDDAIFSLPRSKSKPRSKSNRFGAQGNCGHIKSRQRGSRAPQFLNPYCMKFHEFALLVWSNSFLFLHSSFCKPFAFC
jgi:hypothetical protein